MESKIELKAIKELLGMRFFIPNYQRGYRWTKQQVEDLLNDLNEFEPKDDGFYCLQPLVVKKRERDIFRRIKDEAQNLDEIKQLLKEEWEVIDGQQRLTTIFIILSCLKTGNLYSLEYETRADIQKENDNIDYYHVYKAQETIKDWLYNKNHETFKEKLLSDVKFIWYESVDNPIQIFTRLNIGKISLTNAELIKALFLNRTNFGVDDGKKNNYIRSKQLEVASEWDHIEYTLQEDEFWLFLHEKGYDRPTRIDFIFDLICDQNSLSLAEDAIRTIGSDGYKTFRYFYAYFKSGKSDIYECWKKVKAYYQIFHEWYNDLELYHYIGYLIDRNVVNIKSLVSDWGKSKDKASFITSLKKKIGQTIQQIEGGEEHQYKTDGSDKRKSIPILLFHNIQTVINQNRTQRNNSKYQLGTFYKFPFHLFKLESWDVEHINSATENLENDINTQREWLSNAYVGADEATKLDIKKFFDEEDENKRQVLFDSVKERLQPRMEEWTEEEKNRIWNYALLDSSTNRSYGNTIFSGKRRIIIGKEKGKYIAIPKVTKNGKLEIGDEEEAQSSFVPPCTKQVFLKYYTPTATDSNYWTKADAKAYLKDIKDCLNCLNQ